MTVRGLKNEDLPEGWLLPSDDELLAKYARGMVLEVGSYKGRSTVILARRAVRVWSVDPHGPYKAALHGHGSWEDYLRNLTAFGVADKVQVCRMTSENAFFAPDLPELFDTIWIDGDHDSPVVDFDFRMWPDRLAPGGHLLAHDFEHPETPDTTRAIRRLLDSGHWYIAEQENYMVVMRRTA